MGKHRKQKIRKQTLYGADVNAFEVIDVRTLKPIGVLTSTETYKPFGALPRNRKQPRAKTFSQAVTEARERQARRERLEQAHATRGNESWNNRKMLNFSSVDSELDERFKRSTQRLEELERKERRARWEAIAKAGEKRRARESEKLQNEIHTFVVATQRESQAKRELEEIKAQEAAFLRREWELDAGARQAKRQRAEEQETAERIQRLRAAHAKYLARNSR